MASGLHFSIIYVFVVYTYVCVYVFTHTYFVVFAMLG